MSQHNALNQTINIALPKGRLGNQVYELLSKVGFDCEELNQKSRKLVIENEENNIKYFLVKPSDVAIYVERGTADIGVVGKDTLNETLPDVYELLDLKLGKCRIAVAGLNGFKDDGNGTLRVATKYVNIAKEYYLSKNRDIEVIKLSGSIELAPILGLSDVIVDIVETGSTLRENDMSVITDIMPVSARLIANRASHKFKNERISKLVKDLSQALAE